MKIVINTCFGGFGLSADAEDLYAVKSGFELFRYEQTKYQHIDGEDLYEKVLDNSKGIMFYHTFKKDQGPSYTDYPGDESYWMSNDIKRNDPILIKVVEELGDKANGLCASLEIVEIPDGIDWEIDEYDGSEHIAECHRTWS